MVAFLSQEREQDGAQIPRGTCFFVAVPIRDGRGVAVYLVTARHVIDKARASGRALFLRANERDGGLAIRDLPDYDAWHVSARTDVAILAAPPIKGLDVKLLPAERFATPAFLEAEKVGAGDEVFFVGLFTGHPGSERNEPIVRFGNVSMLPNEPVRIRNADGSVSRVSAFLVEARSWGGQSGSPAFVWLSPFRDPGMITLPQWSGGDPGAGGKLAPGGEPQLLGLVCGHFELD
jgi:hypothetical protein